MYSWKSEAFSFFTFNSQFVTSVHVIYAGRAIREKKEPIERYTILMNAARESGIKSVSLSNWSKHCEKLDKADDLKSWVYIFLANLLNQFQGHSVTLLQEIMYS